MSNRELQISFAIIEAIDKIFNYNKNLKDYTEFRKNNQITDASLMNFVVIGELTNKLSDNFKSKNSQIDWISIKGFRNIIAHDYFGVDYEEVWQIINNELPKLKIEFQKIVELNNNNQKPMF